MLQILVADGNARDGRAQHVAATGQTSAQSYGAILTALAPEVAVTILNPADADAELPRGTTLASFDGVIVTGSVLHVTDATPAVERQAALMRDCLAAGRPVFGSCWGVQVAAVVRGAGPTETRAGRNTASRAASCRPGPGRSTRSSPDVPPPSMRPRCISTR
jgi:GMP synthase (glutamine-hydrolysing)